MLLRLSQLESFHGSALARTNSNANGNVSAFPHKPSKDQRAYEWAYGPSDPASSG